MPSLIVTNSIHIRPGTRATTRNYSGTPALLLEDLEGGTAVHIFIQGTPDEQRLILRDLVGDIATMLASLPPEVPAGQLDSPWGAGEAVEASRG